MADTLTISIAAAALRRLADDEGQPVEALAQRFLEEAALDADGDRTLSEGQIADLRERAKHPSPIASPERTNAVLRKFGIER